MGQEGCTHDPALHAARPISETEQQKRLLAQRAHIEGQIASQLAWNTRNPHKANKRRIERLRAERTVTLHQLKLITGELQRTLIPRNHGTLPDRP